MLHIICTKKKYLQEYGSCLLSLKVFLKVQHLPQRSLVCVYPFVPRGSVSQHGASDNIVLLCAHSVCCDPSSSHQLVKAKKLCETSDDSYFIFGFPLAW